MIICDDGSPLWQRAQDVIPGFTRDEEISIGYAFAKSKFFHFGTRKAKRRTDRITTFCRLEVISPFQKFFVALLAIAVHSKIGRCAVKSIVVRGNMEAPV